MRKGKKPGEFLAQKRSHKQRQQNQDTITKLRNGEIFQGDLYALNQNGMCKVTVEAVPTDVKVFAKEQKTIVCLAGTEHKNLHIADTIPNADNYPVGRCLCAIRNKSSSIVTLDMSKVFGVVLNIEELENKNGR